MRGQNRSMFFGCFCWVFLLKVFSGWFSLFDCFFFNVFVFLFKVFLFI